MTESVRIELDTSNYIAGCDPISMGDQILLPSAYSDSGVGMSITVLHKDSSSVITARKLSKYSLIRRFQFWFDVRWYAFKYYAKVAKEKEQ